MNKQKILAEIRRTAQANNNIPLGLGRFYLATGIRETDWKGKIWARWGDAVREAGYEPNKFSQIALDEEMMVEKYAAFVRELGKLPVTSEMRLKKRSDPTFPNEKVLRLRFGNKPQLIKRLAQFCESKAGYDDILRLCLAYVTDEYQPTEESDSGGTEDGFVYLLRAGRFYKVGQMKDAGRRKYDLAIQFPLKADEIHVIRTDDPIGIEAYWHRRFESKRKNGEWFELDSADIRAFKRRKFM